MSLEETSSHVVSTSGPSAWPGAPPAYSRKTNGPISVMTATTDNLPGYEITTPLGIVAGVVIEKETFTDAFGKNLQTRVHESHVKAIQRMIDECKRRGGNAVVGVKMDSAGTEHWYKVSAYGSACVVKAQGGT